MTKNDADAIPLTLTNADIDAVMNASQLTINYAALQSLQSDELLQKLLVLKDKFTTGVSNVISGFSTEEVILMKNFVSHGAQPNDAILSRYFDKSLHDKGL